MERQVQGGVPVLEGQMPELIARMTENIIGRLTTDFAGLAGTVSFPWQELLFESSRSRVPVSRVVF